MFGKTVGADNAKKMRKQTWLCFFTNNGQRGNEGMENVIMYERVDKRESTNIIKV